LLSDDDINVRYLILPFLDQSSIAKIAENDPSPKLKETALKLITDQSVLERFIVPQEDLHLLTVAIDKLNNMDVLSNTIRKMVDIYGHQKVGLVAEESIRQDVVQQYKFVPFLKIAIAKLTDQSTLAHIAINCNSAYAYYEVQSAVDKLDDQSLLLKVAQNNDTHPCARLTAAMRVRDISQSVFADILKKERSAGFLAAKEEFTTALDMVTDQNLLLDVANYAKNLSIRLDAMSRLTDKSGLVFPLSADECMKMDRNFNKKHEWFSMRDLHLFPIIIENGRRFPQCPYCGCAIKRCNDHRSRSPVNIPEDENKW
jgi:hypothetical protein